MDSYKNKSRSNKWYRLSIIILCSLILLAFSGVFIYLIVQFDFQDKDASINNLIQVITVCITFLTLIVSTLRIVVKYVFPEKEEEYITRIVELIQNNDLENKKENIRVQAHNQKETDRYEEMDFEK